MSASLIAGVYTVDGCRNGQSVQKIVKLTGANCELVTYSDGGTDSGWTEGHCTHYDYEKLVLCAEDGTKVLVESYVDIEDPDQERTTRYTNLATGAPWIGDPNTLVACTSEEWDIQTKQYCDNGETVFGTLVFEVQGNTPVLVSIIYHKADGSIHTPINPVEGSCKVTYNNNDIFQAANGSIVTLNANDYHSVSITVLEGTADITVGSKTINSITAGFSSTYTASTLLENVMVITAGANSRVIITSIS